MTQSPLLFLVFNRPKQTARVFEAIRAAKPPRLYVSADGPRANRKGEAECCEEVRRIATRVDWPCEVKTLFRETNLGCKMGVSGGITWFFEHEDQGIILEDDCLPHPDFFRFCDALLDRYQNDERVWVITGQNHQNGQWRGNGSYYFSRYNHVWGWASWRRAWANYKGDIPFWSTWRNQSSWRSTIEDSVERHYRERIFDSVFQGKVDTWDYPWAACVYYGGGLTATPNVNLVSNIGFGPDATHTVSSKSVEGQPTEGIGDIVFLTNVIRDVEADRYEFDHFYGGKNLRWPRRGFVLIKKAIKKILKYLYLGNN